MLQVFPESLHFIDSDSMLQVFPESLHFIDSDSFLGTLQHAITIYKMQGFLGALQHTITIYKMQAFWEPCNIPESLFIDSDSMLQVFPESLHFIDLSCCKVPKSLHFIDSDSMLQGSQKACIL